MLLEFPLTNSSSLMLHEAVGNVEAIGKWETRLRRLKASQKSSGGGPLSIGAVCESKGVTFEESIGRAGLVLETNTVLDTNGLPLN